MSELPNRTLRGIAIQKGTASTGFTGMVEYYPQGGYPLVPGYPLTTYQEQPIAFKPAPPPPGPKSVNVRK
jgi:hypothetical protein